MIVLIKMVYNFSAPYQLLMLHSDLTMQKPLRILDVKLLVNCKKRKHTLNSSTPRTLNRESQDSNPRPTPLTQPRSPRPSH